ncbi:toprim domain-containing protein [Gracilibacillus marinus]|uniref:Toprim domain-containing protein n=1 Tax=Gracilibacillus marinus TaxID=630535 RepID=A0ABV8VRM7_9BACI
MSNEDVKLIIVEGKSDKDKVEKLINDHVEIVCTNGTIGIEKLEGLIETYDMENRDVYILVDEDKAGKKLRKQLSKELPHASHIYVDKAFREVAATPEAALATALISSHIMIHPDYLSR